MENGNGHHAGNGHANGNGSTAPAATAPAAPDPIMSLDSDSERLAALLERLSLGKSPQDSAAKLAAIVAVAGVSCLLSDGIVDKIKAGLQVRGYCCAIIAAAVSLLRLSANIL